MTKELVIQILGWMNMGLFSIVTVPQIIKTLKTKKVDDVSIGVYFLILLANSVALAYAILINQVPLMAKYIFGFISGLLYILVYRRYGKNKCLKE